MALNVCSKLNTIAFKPERLSILSAKAYLRNNRGNEKQYMAAIGRLKGWGAKQCFYQIYDRKDIYSFL